MKKTINILIYWVAGALCGVISAFVNTAFIPECGEVCSVEKFSEFILWIIGSSNVFLIIGFIFSKKIQDKPKNNFYIMFLISFSAVAIVLGIYGYKVSKKYWALEGNQVYVNFDFPRMFISEKNIKAQNSKGGDVYVIKQWQRCAGVELICENSPKKIRLQCRESGIYIYALIEEKDWKFLKNVSSENLKDLADEGHLDNDFCHNQNIVK